MNDNAPSNDASIIGEKYRGRYTAENRDWLGTVIDNLCTTAKTKEVAIKDEDGKETGETETKTLKGRTMNIENLFDLSEANGIPAAELYGDQVDRKNAAGRLRMTLGNRLRAIAKRRHGLYGLDGKWMEADAEFIGDTPMSEEKDGTPIPKASVESEASAAA